MNTLADGLRVYRIPGTGKRDSKEIIDLSCSLDAIQDSREMDVLSTSFGFVSAIFFKVHSPPSLPSQLLHIQDLPGSS